LLVSAITLHNILRIGCWSSFGGVAAGISEASIGAVTFIGIGIQNFPEGRVNAVAKNGNEQMESFMYGQSPLVEPIAVLGACSHVFNNHLCFGFAAAAMIFVVGRVTQRRNRIIIRTS
jgi:zinc transporter ZupT